MTTKQIVLVFGCLIVGSYLWKGCIPVLMMLFFIMANGGIKHKPERN